MSKVAMTLKAIKQLKKALGDLAVDMTLKTRVQNEYVPGQPVTYTDTDATVKGVITKFRREEIDGTMVQAIDSLIIVFPTEGSVIPKQNDQVILDAFQFRVVRCDPVYVGSEIAFCTVQARPG